MSNKEHRNILYQGADVWFRWREENESIVPDLRRENFSGSNLQQYDLSEANLSDASFENANLVCAMLIKTDLRGANLKYADLTGADLFGSNLGQVVAQYSKYEKANLGNSEISEANFAKSSLIGVHFGRCNMESTCFNAADMRGAVFDYAIGFNSKFVNSDLRYASLARTKLTDCSFRSAELGQTTFEGAILVNVDFSLSQMSETRLGGTVFINCELGNADGLERCEFSGPCYVDNLTLRKSRIPEAFLIGSGLQDWEIKATELLEEGLTPMEVDDVLYKVSNMRNGRPILIGGIFISYSRQDSRFASVIEKRLKKDDIRCWRDVHDSVSGRLDKQIERAIAVNQIVLLILSESSVNSDWVEWEVSRARNAEKYEGKDRLCPIALDDAWQSSKWSGPLRNQIEQYNILDFSDWKNDESFYDSYRRLIKGLGLFYE